MPEVPKPPKRQKKPRKPLKRTRIRQISARHRAEIPLRKETRAAVILRDRGRCRHCAEQVGTYGHVHEIVFRSQGGSPLELENTVLLCAKCHGLVHLYKLTISVTDDGLGANGELLFTRIHGSRKGAIHDEEENSGDD